MAKLKLTKNELKKQKESLQRFNRYLPTLQLKKQQLQMEIAKIHRLIEQLSLEIDELRGRIMVWVDVFAEDAGIKDVVAIERINTVEGNIAGIDIPVFESVLFKKIAYDYMSKPLWIDSALQVCHQMISLRARQEICRRQVNILKEELRITNQRVNLFEKVKIPEAKENIRVIKIYLGDLQTAGVVRGKIAKAKIEKKKQVAAA